MANRITGNELSCNPWRVYSKNKSIKLWLCSETVCCPGECKAKCIVKEHNSQTWQNLDPKPANSWTKWGTKPLDINWLKLLRMHFFDICHINRREGSPYSRQKYYIGIGEGLVALLTNFHHLQIIPSHEIHYFQMSVFT